MGNAATGEISAVFHWIVEIRADYEIVLAPSLRLSSFSRLRFAQEFSKARSAAASIRRVLLARPNRFPSFIGVRRAATGVVDSRRSTSSGIKIPRIEGINFNFERA